MTQMVQLSDDAYRRLTNAKRPGESYSDTVMRLLGGGNLRDLQDLRSPSEIEEARENIREADRLDRPGA
jgi:predicted CopG family antitoxin